MTRVVLMPKTYEEELIAGCVNGDRLAQKRLYEKFYGKMLAVCLRYEHNLEEAKDILHEGFIKVFTNIHKFQRSGSFEGWIRRIIANAAIDHFRKQRRLNELAQRDYNISDMEQLEFADNSANDDGPDMTIKEILSFVQHLSPAYKNIFNLYVMDGFSHKEIAAMLEISEGTSKSNLAKARMKLQQMIIDYKKEKYSSYAQ